MQKIDQSPNTEPTAPKKEPVYLLWQDNKKTPIEQLLQDAITRYTAKFHTPPTHCYIHPSYTTIPTIPNITVTPRLGILQGYVMVGKETP